MKNTCKTLNIRKFCQLHIVVQYKLLPKTGYNSPPLKVGTNELT